MTELWLAVYYDQNGYDDLSWYNEGRWQEWPYFLRLIGRRLMRRYKSRMHYQVRYGKFKCNFYL